jgi:hypothetical protein
MTDDSTRVPPNPDPDAAESERGQRERDAGQDESINRRLERNPESKEARLDTALDESMDASDPPSSTQPVHSHQPPPSSGYDEEAERKRREGK